MALYMRKEERLSELRIPSTAVYLKIQYSFKVGGNNDFLHAT